MGRQERTKSIQEMDEVINDLEKLPLALQKCHDVGVEEEALAEGEKAFTALKKAEQERQERLKAIQEMNEAINNLDTLPLALARCRDAGVEAEELNRGEAA